MGQEEILKEFERRPERPLTIEELAVILNRSKSSVAQCLEKMIKHDEVGHNIISREKKTPMHVYYRK